MIRSAVSIAFAAALLAAGAAVAGEDAKSAFTPAQREEMKKLVHDYLVQNPDVITEVVKVLQDRDEKAQADKQKALIASKSKELQASPEGTVIGNPKGNITLVEFFDYNCGYCKSLFPSLLETVKADGNIRVVMKEFPILGPSSVVASKAALAAVKQNKYSEFHIALMGHKGALTEDAIMKTAKDVGLDIARLEKDMKSDDIQKVIQRNEDLGKELQVNGTPALVIGTTFVPGAISKDELKKLITEARKS